MGSIGSILSDHDDQRWIQSQIDAAACNRRDSNRNALVALCSPVVIPITWEEMSLEEDKSKRLRGVWEGERKWETHQPL